MTNANAVEAVYPLLPLQQGMLFHALQAGAPDAYFRQSLYELVGELDEACFRRAWQALVARHDVLRTAISHGTVSSQVVFRDVPVPLQFHDLRGMSEPEQEARLRAALAEDQRQGLRLSAAPVMRVAVFRLDERRYRVAWSWHHILLDGWSSVMAIKEVAAHYAAFLTGRTLTLPPPRPYGHFVEWLGRQDLRGAERFWARRLGGFNVPTPLPGDRRARGGEAAGHVETRGSFHERLPESFATKLRTFAQAHRLTPFTLTQAAWAIVLARHAAVDDVVFGTTVAGRPAELAGVESTLGLFINTVPVRVRMRSEETVTAWLARLQLEQAETVAYQHAPLADIQRWGGLRHGRHAFETLLVFENFPIDAFEQAYGAHLRSGERAPSGLLESHMLPSAEHVHYPLGLIVQLGRELAIQATFDTARVPSETARQLVAQFACALDGLVSGAAYAADVRIAGPEHLERVARWNATGTGDPGHPYVHQRFVEQALSTPDAIALVFERQHVSYGELLRRASRLSARLRARGVARDGRVALCLDRSPDLAIATFGVLMAGGAYVPLDPEYPPGRVAFMREHANARIVVTQRAVLARVPLTGGDMIYLDDPDADVDLDDAWDAHASASGPRPGPAVPAGEGSEGDADALAYVMYTSGSTGRPKGVAVTNRALTNFACALIDICVRPGTCMLQYASWSFDVSVGEWATTLLVGGRLVFAPRHRLLPGPDLAALLHEEQIDIAALPPSTLALLDPDGFDALHTVLSVGEACRGSWIPRWSAGRRFLNAYGPTEATVYATIAGPLNDDEAPDIGRPFANMTAYVVDARGELAPIGVPGELCLGGRGVARGYLHQPAQTAERFVPDAWSGVSGARVYRTGDRSRWRADGAIEYLGRDDHQIKLRGFRIELGEVETLLARQPHVRQAAVAVHGARSADERLVAYVVAEEQGPEAISAWRQALKQHLPHYMVPSSFTIVEALPLTPNGKVDRRRLVEHDPSVTPLDTAPRVMPRDNVEIHLLRLWEELLDTTGLGVDDDFLEAGGHSLHALALSERLSRAYRRTFSPAVAFQYPTVRAMAAHLRREVALTLPSTVIPLQTRGARPPLFCVHPASGLVHAYLALARDLGREQPFYGIQSVGLDGGAPLADLEAMAARYAADIVKTQPAGPYLLAGWSLGATLAYEVARQLTASGHHVALVALLDGGPREWDRPTLSFDDAIAAAQAEVLRFEATVELGIPATEFDDVQEDARAAFYLSRAHAAGVVPDDISLESFQRLLVLMAHNVVAHQRYRPRPYDGRVLLLRTAAGGDRGPRGGLPEAVAGPCEVHVVPGDHTDMMREPHVATLARTLRDCLDRALAAAAPAAAN